MVANDAIVRQVTIGHKQVVGSHLGDTTTTFCSNVCGYEFAKHVPVAGNKVRNFTVILKVLRNSANARVWKDFAIFP